MASWFTRRRPIPAAIRKNIESIAQLEQEFARRRTAVDRVGDAITRSAGSIWFVVAHVLGFASWILLNAGCLTGVAPFDPYPFSLLGLVVALEAVILSTFVLMTQNRQNRQADQWNPLALLVHVIGRLGGAGVLVAERKSYGTLASSPGRAAGRGTARMARELSPP